MRGSTLIIGLLPTTAYNIRMSASNINGEGAISESYMVNTTEGRMFAIIIYSQLLRIDTAHF